MTDTRPIPVIDLKAQLARIRPEIDEAVERDQVAFLKKTKEARDNGAVRGSLEELKAAAAAGRNLMPPLLECARRYVTLGETSDALTEVFGSYREQPFY